MLIYIFEVGGIMLKLMFINFNFEQE